MPISIDLFYIYNIAFQRVNICIINSNKLNMHNKTKKMSFLPQIPLSIKIGIVIIIILIIVCFIVRIAMRPETSYTGKSLQTSVQTFVQKSAQLHQKAIQDAHYVHALNDINRAIAYMNAARSIVSTDEQIYNWTGVYPKEFLSILDECQREIIKNMQEQCPNPFTENPYQQYAGWKGE